MTRFQPVPLGPLSFCFCHWIPCLLALLHGPSAHECVPSSAVPHFGLFVLFASCPHTLMPWFPGLFSKRLHTKIKTCSCSFSSQTAVLTGTFQELILCLKLLLPNWFHDQLKLNTSDPKPLPHLSLLNTPSFSSSSHFCCYLVFLLEHHLVRKGAGRGRQGVREGRREGERKGERGRAACVQPDSLMIAHARKMLYH